MITSLSKDKVEKMYYSWNKHFDELDESEDFFEAKIEISEKFELGLGTFRLGIDFPSWINFEGTKAERKRIMVVGIDPLRECEIKGKVSIGTPYAFHHKKMRGGATSEYWKFISHLAQDYSIYITDIYKIFFKDGDLSKNRSYNNKAFTENKLHHEILTKEIEIVNPNIIITMGNMSTKLVLNDVNQKYQPISRYNVANGSLKYNNTKTELIPMVHLSGSSRGGQKNFLATNQDSIFEKGKPNGESYYQIVRAYLDRQS
jgi:hypothetical protein